MSQPFNSLSRRHLLRGAAGLVAGSAITNVLAQSGNRPRMLALVGDRYHNPDYIRVALTKTFDGLKISVDYTMHYEQLSRELLKNYQVFLCLRDGMIWPGGYLGPDAYTSYAAGLENKSDFAEPKPQQWLTEEQANALKEFVNSGNDFIPCTTTATSRCHQRLTERYRGEPISAILLCVRSRCVLLIERIQSRRGSAISS